MKSQPLLCVMMLSVVLEGGFASAQTLIPPGADDFATSLAQADQFEISAAQEAMAESRDAGVRAFARTMIADHTRADVTLRNAVAASHLADPPPVMSRDQAAMLGAIQSLRGAGFDRTYIQQQILAHEEAIAVVRSYAQRSDDGHLHELAETLLPVLQKHLDLIRNVKASLPSL